MHTAIQLAIAGAIGFAGVTVFSLPDSGTSLFSAVAQHCNIKGNISISSGERIYHVLGQEYYSETRISPEYGERWFCTEAEARAAGWRKSKR